MKDARRRKRRARRGREAEDAVPVPEPEERLLREARRRANAKIGFYTHFVSYASVLMFLAVVTRGLRVPMIVGAAWGIGLVIHYFAALVAPTLRQRLVAEELGQRVEKDVHRERRAIETRNARSLEDLSASIAHEIRNPITAAKSLVQQMGEDPVAPENIDYAKVALDELDRVERSISHLLRYARDTDVQRAQVDLCDVVESAVETLREPLEARGVSLRAELDGPCRVHGDPEKLRRVLINLVGNALDAFEEDDTPAPAIEIHGGENLAGTDVWLRVRDNGPGIPDETLARVWSPFFTTKESGTGLGLALSRKIVEAHGGEIEAASSPGAGTEFILTLPKQPRAGGTA